MNPLIRARLPRMPGSDHRLDVLGSAVLVIIATIVVVDLLTIGTPATRAGLMAQTIDAWPPGGYIALAVSLTGFVLSWWHPWPGLVVVAAAPVVCAVLGWDPIATWNLSIFTSLWLTLRTLPGLPAGLLTGAANFCAVALAQGGFTLDQPTPSIAALAAIAAAGIGSAVRGHRLYAAELERRASDALANREAEADRRVALERVRIARDLHDVVGHEVALISMHLGAAQVHLPDGADTARADLAAARDGVQSVLANTQQILKVLRAGTKDESTSPAAGYEHITDLVETSRAAGIEIEATIGDPATTLSSAVSAAAYRIVQEALTNAQRHGTGGVSLTVAADREAVTIETVNVRRVPDSSVHGERSGYGLVGMRERAASVGGWVDTRTEDTIFWLWVYLPVAAGGTQ